MKTLKKIIIILIWFFLWFFSFKIYDSYKDISQYITNWQININWLRTYFSSNDAENITNSEKYKRFDEIYNILKLDYIDQEKINSWQMLEKAIKAFVDWIDDPYTVYMDADTNSWFEQDLKWEMDFEWIGAVVTKKDYYVLIEETIKESPAFKAWLLPMDRIIIVDTWSVKDLDIYEAVDRIKWPQWTKVRLIIERILKDWTKDIIEKEVVREKLNIPSVTSKVIDLKSGKKVWYVNITLIWEETDNIFRKEILSIKQNNISWIILDLRWNWWWLLPVAVNVASHFIPEWKVVVSSKYQSLPGEIYNSNWFTDLENYPTVVLIDEITASAWEIIAIALQEQIWAKLVWEKTFWKWTIQTLEDFSDWTSMKYTIWKWYSPSDKNIDWTWVSPDYQVAFDMTGYIENRFDSQLEKAKIVLDGMIK